MAKRKLEFSLLALFDGSAAMRGLKGFLRRATTSTRGMTRKAGLGAGFAGIGARGRPGGAGGILSGITQGAASLALAPVRILGGFARLIPGVGGILGGVVASAANILQGLVGIVANVVGGIINAFGKMLTAVVGIFQKMVGAAGRILGKISKIALGVGLGVGAIMGWQMLKGIRENMALADWRQVLEKVFGEGAKVAEEYARQLSLKTPFTPMQMIETVAGLGAAELDYKRFMKTIVDWSAGAKRPLEEITTIFQRIQAGQFGEALEMARRGLISSRDLRQMGIEFDKGGRALTKPMELIEALAAVVQRRFGDMAEQAAEVGSGPWSTFVGVIQDLRMQLTGAWYDRFNDGLKRMNTWLLSLAQTPAWRSLVAGSSAAGNAVYGWITNRAIPALQRLHDWLTTRDWAKAWEGLKAAPKKMWEDLIPDIGKLFGEKTEEGLQMGPLTAMVVAGVRYLKAQVLIVLEGLWAAIGERATEAMRAALYAMRDAINTAMVKQMERKQGVPGAMAVNVMGGMVGGLELTARALYNLGQTANSAEEHIKEHAESARKAAEDMDALAEAVKDATVGPKIKEGPRAGEREGGIVGKAGKMGAETFPALPPEKVAERPRAAALSAAEAAVRGSEPWKAGMRRAARNERLAEQFRKVGRDARAAELQEEATKLREEMTVMLTQIVEDQKATKEELRQLRRLVHRLATAKA